MTCACTHEDKEHVVGLFETKCNGKFWADAANVRCPCTELIDEDVWAKEPAEIANVTSTI